MSPSPFVSGGYPGGSVSSSPSAQQNNNNLSLIRLLCMFSVSFSYGLVFNTVNNIVIPNEIERLTTSRQSMWVGLIMASGAVSQFATPVAGAWSDASGDRIRFLLAGSLVTVCGVIGFSVVSSSHSVFLLFISQIITTVGLSVQYAMVTALLNDHVPVHQAGAGSGALAILGILGSGVGYSLFALDIPSQYSFMCYIGCTIGCVAMSTFFIPSSSRGEEEEGEISSSSPLSGSILNTSPPLSSSTPPSSLPFALPALAGGPSSSLVGGAVTAKVMRSSDAVVIEDDVCCERNTAVVAKGGAVISSSPTRRGSPPILPMAGNQPSTSKKWGGAAAKNINYNHLSSAYPRKRPSRTQVFKRLTNGTLQRAEAASTTCLSFCGDMLPSPSRSPDFFFACLGRGLFNCGLSGQVYLVYYLRDIIHVKNPIQIASLVAVGALVGGIVGALPAGILSDRIGKKPIIYVAIGVCVVSLAMFLMVSSVNTVQIIGFVYGIGNVGYLSVDYALGVQALPSGGPTKPTKSRKTISSKRLPPSSAHHQQQQKIGGGAGMKTSHNLDLEGGGGCADPREEEELQLLSSPNNNTTPHHHTDITTGTESTDDDGDITSSDGSVRGGTHMYEERDDDDGHQTRGMVEHHVAATRERQRRSRISRKGSMSKGAAHAGKDLGVFAMSATFGQVAGQLIFGTVLDQFSMSSFEPIHGKAPQSQSSSSFTTMIATTILGDDAATMAPAAGHREVMRYTYMGFIVIYSLGAVAFILSGVFTSFIKNVD